MNVDDNLAYDIGAFDGDTISMINQLGYMKVVCFEPHPVSFARMKARYGGVPNIVLENLAVSESSGQIAKMTVVPDHPYLNSLETSWFSTSRHPSNGSHVIDVRTISLNDYIEKDGKIPAYIKIDAEGHEIPILKGLKYKPRKVSMEWVSEFLDKNLVCVSMLNDLGFREYRMGFGEAIPSTEPLTFEQCCETLKHYAETDSDRKIWGNIWCS